MEFQIQSLADHQLHIPTLAACHHAQFGYLAPAVTIEQRIEKLTASAQKGKLPFTIVAIVDNQLIGAASLLPKTITHQHLSPWLSSVYVAPKFRKQGIGSALTQHLLQESANIGIEKVYLFTPNAEALYASLGWSVMEYSEYLGHQITIMSISTKAIMPR
ncbi:MAG: GNAT family N-acetyltransferase [Burkholderiaceae bacterium]